ncbi:MAG: phosphate signaling complex protein PhoU [Oscillospiraceae bacterium]|nr:phosphate signaling complex protein PhoU [Oscillospiraceae bacterium]
MRNKFEAQLVKINDMLIEMGSLIEKSISMATDALEKKDVKLAKKAIAFDEEINQKEKDIESLCLKVLLQQQPVAKDLRLVSAALKMITDMERIGDQATDISEITLLLARTQYVKKLEVIPKMADITAKMVTQSIDAFVRKDLSLAKAVIEADDKVDELFMAVKNDCIENVRTGNADGEQVIDLMMVAKYFERIGDHAVNIAGWVVFSITGKHNKG